MVVAVNFPDLTVKGAASGNPINELRAQGPGKSDHVTDRIFRHRLRVVDHLVQTPQVEILVDEAGPFPIQLMRQTAGADDDDFEILPV